MKRMTLVSAACCVAVVLVVVLVVVELGAGLMMMGFPKLADESEEMMLPKSVEEMVPPNFSEEVAPDEGVAECQPLS